MQTGETLEVASREEFRDWLALNHKVKSEIWLSSITSTLSSKGLAIASLWKKPYALAELTVNRTARMKSDLCEGLVHVGEEVIGQSPT